MISIKSTREIEVMRESCKLAAKTLHYLGKRLKIGMSTEDINTMCHQYTLNRGAIPATLGYHGYPKSLCTSRNEIICHGIPTPKDILKDGDIINLDVTNIWKGFHGDTNATFLVGNVKPEYKKLVDVTYNCMMAGISVCRPGARIGDIGAVIEELAHANGYSVVHEYCGHGIGRQFHEDPQIVHVGKKGTGVEMRPGMTFTIEPMINFGKRHCKLLDDGWTVITKDKSWSAQFEHTILITETGHEILTQFSPEEWTDQDDQP
ncbi:MAG TPA: type I methionyl aminopeptidase [Bacteriovoracaceae bacterium]|nr:type I methionyl aminopeptidase [Bacteriovoracaceae bacterium]